MRSIARTLGVSRGAVARAIHGQEAARAAAASGALSQRQTRRSLLDPLEETIGQWLTRYPEITIVRLLEELRASGYEGGYTILRQHVKALRGSPRGKLVQRFETAPGAQAQMDWAVYTLDFTDEGRRRVKQSRDQRQLRYSIRHGIHLKPCQNLLKSGQKSRPESA